LIRVPHNGTRELADPLEAVEVGDARTWSRSAALRILVAVSVSGLEEVDDDGRLVADDPCIVGLRQGRDVARRPRLRQARRAGLWSLETSAAESSLAAVRTIILVGPRGLRLRTAVPETRRGRMRGLIDRVRLGPDEALLLERTRSVHTFGMRFPITAALLDRDGVVRGVVRMTPRRLLLPRPGLRHVLELAEDADVRLGDRLEPAPATRSRWARSSR
jgi:uncharacterized protein